MVLNLRVAVQPLRNKPAGATTSCLLSASLTTSLSVRGVVLNHDLNKKARYQGAVEPLPYWTANTPPPKFTQLAR